jgi:hypothetical protein
MNRFTSWFLVLLFSCVSVQAAYSLGLSDIVDAQTAAELKKSGSIQKTYYKQKSMSLTLTPDTEFSKKTQNAWPSSNGNPVFVVETLNYILKSDLNASDTDSVTIEKASQIMRSISKMQGMQYYSNSSKKWKPLYKESYCIKGPKDRTKVPDDTEGSADGKTIYIMQNDNSFGKTNYQLDYSQTKEEVSILYVNTTPLYGPLNFKAVEKNNLCVYLVVTDCGEGFAVYMVTMAKFPTVDFLESTMNESFSARLNAIFSWFCKQF